MPYETVPLEVKMWRSESRPSDNLSHEVITQLSDKQISGAYNKVQIISPSEMGISSIMVQEISLSVMLS